jgi:uncharacterized protein (DUF2267 family)
MNLNSIYEILGSILIGNIIIKKIYCDGFQQDSHTITKIERNFILHVIKGDLGHIREVSRKWCKSEENEASSTKEAIYEHIDMEEQEKIKDFFKRVRVVTNLIAQNGKTISNQ